MDRMLNWLDRAGTTARCSLHLLTAYRLLPNPYYRAISVITKMQTNIVSMIWALTVLCNRHALGLTAYAGVADYLPERCLAFNILLLCALQSLWLVRHWPPLRFGNAGYVFLLVCWSGVFYSVLFADPADPTTIPGLTLILATSFVAVVTNPRHSEGAHAIPA